MSKSRRERPGRDGGGTLTLEEAAASLGVSVGTLLEALEDSGVQVGGHEADLRLEAGEVESYRRLVEKGRAKGRERLAALRGELED